MIRPDLPSTLRTAQLALAAADLLASRGDSHCLECLLTVPGPLHVLSAERDDVPEPTLDSTTAHLLDVLADCAQCLPWDASADQDAEVGSWLAVSSRLLAELLPAPQAGLFPVGVVDLDDQGGFTGLVATCNQFRTEVARAGQQLRDLVGDHHAGEWVDPALVCAYVADIHDLARGLATAASLVSALTRLAM